MTLPPTLNVLFLASEADPLIKVGGLADVAGSLPRALINIQYPAESDLLKLDVRLVLPFHPAIHKENYPLQLVSHFTVHSLRGDIPVDVYELNLDGLPVYLIKGAPIDQETGVYSSNLEADGYKYIFFSQAALLLPKYLDWQIDILHANDWHTAAAVYSLALNRPIDPFFRNTASILTVHNLPYMGALSSNALTAFELPPTINTSLPTWAIHTVLPLGLLTADSIVAVSPGYAKEILTEEFGSGLHSFLRARSGKITGILNGLDTEKWNPLVDEDIPQKYGGETLEDRLINKGFLQDELGLEKDSCTPLLAMVTRMDPQKGVDIAIDALRLLLNSTQEHLPPFQVVFLGTGDPMLEQSAQALELAFPNRVRAKITYNERLSRHIYAGADMLLMPSRYEPCGLSQMIAMRYGCVPIARATGGLSDTIEDPSETDDGTGFLFRPPTPEALAETIRRALWVYSQVPIAWKEIQLRGMRQDFSWDQSAKKYLEQYKKLVDARKNG